MLFSVLFSSITAALSLAGQSPYQAALVELQNGKLDQAYARLEKLSPEDAEFVDAIVEMQKLHYRKQDWQRFFAYATFYRKKYLSTTEEIARRHFRARLITLEVLALAKHCLFENAKTIGEQAIQLGRAIGAQDLDEIQSALTHHALAREFPQAIKGRPDLDKPAAMFSEKLLWRVSSSELNRLTHPKNLRMIVNGRCENS